MKSLVLVLLLSLTATAQAQIAAKGLILNLDADKGVEVEDGDRVVKWTNQVTTLSARDFVKQDPCSKPGTGKHLLINTVRNLLHADRALGQVHHHDLPHISIAHENSPCLNVFV